MMMAFVSGVATTLLKEILSVCNSGRVRSICHWQKRIKAVWIKQKAPGGPVLFVE
ncbi:MAG: hypothetical protein IJV69_06055 [Kiritimatiellae bacterium]|nr:hypothetical protein [Kiritimatiellia bacterium]